MTSLVAAKETSLLQVQVTKADVTLSREDVSQYGVPPAVYTYSFRECFFCNYTCATQACFQKQQPQLQACLKSCSEQDFCKEWVKPLYKRPATPHAQLWKLVNVPADLACDLKLAVRKEQGSSYIYKPLYVPWPWQCATPIEYITPEYKPDPQPVIYITPGYALATSAVAPVHALSLYLPPSIIAQHKLAPTNQTVVIYGN